MRAMKMPYKEFTSILNPHSRRIVAGIALSAIGRGMTLFSCFSSFWIWFCLCIHKAIGCNSDDFICNWKSMYLASADGYVDAPYPSGNSLENLRF